MEKNHLDNLIFNCLGYEKDEKIGLIYDSYFQPISNSIIQYCAKKLIPIKNIKIKYQSGKKMPNSAKEIFLNHTNNILILGFLENIWHTPERKKAKYHLGKRIVNLLYAGENCESYNSEIPIIQKTSEKLFSVLHEKQGAIFHATTLNGTDLIAKIGKVNNEKNQIFYETGYYAIPGSGGDFPSGEVGFSPISESVKGKIVYDIKIQYVGQTNSHPLIVEIKNDKIVSVKGALKEKFLSLLSKNSCLNFLSEISIGTNPFICFVEDINSIIEEKNLGTFHTGYGGNWSYGTRKGPHFDGVINKPTITIDNQTIMKDGIPKSF